MMRSMFSGVSGLRVHQTKMDVIANNIANVNTVGYKSNRVTFNEVFSQTISGASAANAATGRGGTNPRQIGLGSSVASIDKLMTQGASQRTDNGMDLMIEGDGFFVVGDTSGTYFTRAGNFVLDDDGNLNLNGLKLLGWNAELDPNTKDYKISKGQVKEIVIAGNKEYIPPVSTTLVNVTGNINAQKDGKKGVERNMTVYDSVGNKYTVPIKMTVADTQPSTDQTVWNYEIIGVTPSAGGNKVYYAYPNGDTSNPVAFNFGFGGTAGTTSGTLTFDKGGALTAVTPPVASSTIAGHLQVAMTMTPIDRLTPAADFGDSTNHTIIIDFTDLHQYAEETSCRIDFKDGNTGGNLEGLSIAGDGRITGYYTNGMTRLLAQVPIATFKNAAGLEKVGNNLFRETANSGVFDGVGLDGTMQSGVLEMSNVDLASEFTEMITTQRGFQASSRIITTSDDMLQELVNLKR